MNKYEKKARKESFLSGADDKTLPTKERLGKTVASTGIMLITGLAGGFVGAGTGRWSLLTGLLVAGTGQFTGTPAVTAFGLGMATSNVFGTSADTVSGTDDKKKPMMEAAKERIKNYAQGIKQKLFLDKILTSKKKDTAEKTTTTETEKTETANGVGEVKVFKYPVAQPDKVDLAEMERFEKELEKSAEKYMQNSESSPTTFTGTDDKEDRIY